MKVYYEEKYGGIYEVPDEIANNDEKLTDDLMEQFNIHNECQGSTTVRLIGNGDPQYQIMGGLIDALDEKEKEFYLWHLLRFYYKRKLLEDKKKYENEIQERNFQIAIEIMSRLITRQKKKIKDLREFIKERGLIEEYWEWAKKGENENGKSNI